MPKKRKSTSPSSSLSDNLIITYAPPLRRLLSRLSKASLVELSRTWLTSTTVNLTRPEDEDEDEGQDAEELSLEDVRGIYENYARNKSVRTKEVVERITQHEWREGLSLGQVAELDLRYLLDHPTCQKWTSAQIYPLSKPQYSERAHTPFVPQIFTHTLRTLLHPILMPHFRVAHHPSLPLHLIRVQLHPAHTVLTLPTGKHVFWLAFPETCGGWLFHTMPAGGGGDSLAEIVRESIAAAVVVGGRGCRFGVRGGRMSARTLEAVAYHRGGEGGGGMLGAWSIYLGDGDGVDPNPLSVSSAPREEEEEDEAVEDEGSKRRKIAQGRFGDGAIEGDGTGLENVVVVLDEEFPGDEEFRPKVTVRLEGSHVFAGVRRMVEDGVGFDGGSMPAWLTGEAGVTVGSVRNGRIRRTRVGAN